MAINKNAYTRYLIIDDCIRKMRFEKITVNFLKQYILEETGIKVSERTIKADIETMRDNPQILAPIENNKKNGYYYSDESFTLSGLKLTNNELQQLKDAVDVLQQVSGLRLGNELGKILAKIKSATDNDLQDVLLLDQSELNSGSKHIDFLLRLIKAKQCCEFYYIKHNKKEDESVLKKRVVSPLGLKEYLKQWYLVGLDKKSKDLRIFALDRINNLAKSDEKFEKPKGFSAKEYFKYAFGITVHNNKKPSNILLRVKPPCMEFMQNSPWHFTQKIEKISKDEMIVSFLLHESHELVKEILGWGLSIEVLEPTTLKERILKELKEALANYN